MLARVDTELYADAVEFCPVQQHYDVMVCATYQLDEAAKQRLGRLYVFDTSHDELRETQRIDGAGTLDIKWSTINESDAWLGQASADGCLTLRQLRTQETLDGAVALDRDGVSVTLNDDDGAGDPEATSIIALSLDWDNYRHPTATSAHIVVSSNRGDIHWYDVSNERLELAMSWRAHEYEAWIAAIDQWTPSTVYTGSDDCTLKAWDVRSHPSRPLWTKRYDMGVTTIESNRHNEHLIAVGSYDESLSVFDVRSPRNALALIGTGGGVWRVKHHPSDASLLLTASMHNGFHVFQLDDTQELQLVCSYKDVHKTLAYGADWKRGPHGTPSTAGCCSFYDHLCSLWRPPTPINNTPCTSSS